MGDARGETGLEWAVRLNASLRKAPGKAKTSGDGPEALRRWFAMWSG